MAQNNESGGNGARFALAVLSPIIIAAGFVIAPFLPAIAVYLDGRTRTYTAAASTLLGCVALPMILGPGVYAISAFIAIATAAAYILWRVKAPFSTGLVGSAAGGVLGAVALLGIVSIGYSQPINVVIASSVANGLKAQPDILSQFAGMFVYADKNGAFSIFQLFGGMNYASLVAGKTAAEMASIVQNGLEAYVAAVIPAAALVGGMLVGGLGYYLPVRALDRRSHRGTPLEAQAKPISGETAGEAVADVPVPPFAAFKVPRYIVITLLLLQIASYFLVTAYDNPGVDALNMAAYTLFNTLMIIQALSMLSFFMNRRRIPGAAQFALLTLSVILLSCVLPYVGIFDALFDMRAVTTRMDMVRSKGKQVFTQEGLDELRKMEQRKKNGKDKDDKNGGEGTDL